MGEVHRNLLPHPAVGGAHTSPVTPSSCWPSEVADATTPVARGPAQVRKLAARSYDVADLQAVISVCRACPRLVRWREKVALEKRRAFSDEPYWGRPVPSFGDPNPRLLIVGLAPAAHGGNRTGRMFTGDRSGDWIIAALYRAGFANQASTTHAADGLHLHGARIVSPVHCAPPENKPSATEKRTCGQWFQRELELTTEVTGIVTLGGFAWQATLAAAAALGWLVPRPRPRFGHGSEAIIEVPGRGPVRVVGCYHVSQHNTFTGRLTESMIDEIFARFG